MVQLYVVSYGYRKWRCGSGGREEHTSENPDVGHPHPLQVEVRPGLIYL
jgi:hypothetical protein